MPPESEVYKPECTRPLLDYISFVNFVKQRITEKTGTCLFLTTGAKSSKKQRNARYIANKTIRRATIFFFFPLAAARSSQPAAAVFTARNLSPLWPEAQTGQQQSTALTATRQPVYFAKRRRCENLANEPASPEKLLAFTSWAAAPRRV